jgi:hypothetical protein
VAASALLFAAVATLSRVATLRVPLDRDTGQYLYVANEILHGGTPYVDAANNKGPVTFLLFAGIRAVSGHSVVAVRLTLIVFAALAALAVCLYVAQFAGRAAGVLAGIAFAALGSAQAIQGEDPNTEQYGVAPMAWAWFLAARGTRRSLFAAGALASAATLMNVGFAVIWPIVLLEAWRSSGEGPWSRPGRILPALAGGAIVAGVMIGWLAVAGALDEMRIQVFAQATRAVGGNLPLHLAPVAHPTRLHPGSLLDVPAWPLWAIALAGSAAAMRRPRLRPAAVGAMVWILVMWGRVQLSGYAFPHHYYAAMPGIAAALGLGVAAIPSQRWRVAVASCLIAVPFVAYVAIPQGKALRLDPSMRPSPEGPAASASYPISAFISAHTVRGDKVIVAGSEPQVYWLSGREAPTRFFDLYPLLWAEGQAAARYSAERRADLLRRPPAALAVPPGHPLDADLTLLLERFPYRLAYDVNDARIWLLEAGVRPGPPSASAQRSSASRPSARR